MSFQTNQQKIKKKCQTEMATKATQQKDIKKT